METAGKQIIILKSRLVTLRPMEEADRVSLFDWNNRLEFSYFDSGEESAGYTLERLQKLAHDAFGEGFYFVIEFDGRAVGGCWLEPVDKEWILEELPDLDCRRMGVFLADGWLWQRGVGNEVVRLLMQFGFEEQDADVLFYCDVPEDEANYLKALETNLFVVYRTELPDGDVQKASHDLMLMRETYDDAQID